jgi:hypothetical protein
MAETRTDLTSRERAAVAAVTETVAEIQRGGWPNTDTLAHHLVYDTDGPTLALAAAFIVLETGDAGAAALIRLGLTTARGDVTP